MRACRRGCATLDIWTQARRAKLCIRDRSGGVKTLIVILIILLALLAAGYAAVRIYFPLRYEDSVRQYSEKYGIDPYFVCAVIWTESKFDVHASSGAGAQGLMQLCLLYTSRCV